jgi:glycosyltransferase involved in cell wall biosynthesis
MRILLTTESYLPYVSGVTVSVDALARGLGARGHDVLVMAPRPAAGQAVGDVGSPGPEPGHAWLASYQLPRLAPPSYRMPWPLPWQRGLKEARAFRPDVVHAQSPFITGLLGRRIATATGAPLVFTHHTLFAAYRHYLGPLAVPGRHLTDAYLRRWWTSCAAIIAPSADLAMEIRSKLRRDRRERVSVIPTGIDIAGIRALDPVDPRGLAGWPDDAIVVASLGRLAPEKSPMILLDAMAAAAARTRRVRLLMIGGGPMEDELQRRSRQPDLAGRVHFTGGLPRPEALAHLAGADLFAFASRTETQGLVLAEALAAGLPAITLDGPGVRDSVRDGVDGRIVPSDTPVLSAARLAQAIEELATDDTGRIAMAERARADAGRFAIEQRMAETEALYRSALR